MPCRKKYDKDIWYLCDVDKSMSEIRDRVYLQHQVSILGKLITRIRTFIYKFNVFHVRALYYTKTVITNKMHKESFIINRNTLLHVSTLLGHLQGELFCYRYTNVALYS
jgi:hypothetical protein